MANKLNLEILDKAELSVPTTLSLPSKRLNDKHFQDLTSIRKLPTDWVTVNCYSADIKEASDKLGYTAKSPGIILEGHGLQIQFKPDKPWKTEGTKGIGPKYRTPITKDGDGKNWFDVMLPKHPSNPEYWKNLDELKQQCYQMDGHPCLLLTEGFFKAIAGCSNGLPTVSLLGVEMGLTSKRNDIQGERHLGETLKKFALAGFGFVIAFDADCATNDNVFLAQRKLIKALERFNVPVYVAQWPIELGKGMDDHIQMNGADKFKREVLAKAQTIEQWELQFKERDEEKASSQPPKPRKLGRELAEDNRERWKFDNPKKTWRIYDESKGIWEAVDDDVFNQDVFRAVEAKGIDFSTHSYIENVVKILKNLLLQREWVTADRSKFINFANGTLSIETLKLEKHSPGHGFTSYIDRNWHILHNIPTDPIEALQTLAPNFYKYAAYAFDGNNTKILKLLAVFNGVLKFRLSELQYLVVIEGVPGAGKGVLNRLLEKMVGSASCESSSLARLTSVENGYEIAKIIDAQLVICPDEEVVTRGFTTIQQLTGQDRIPYRQIYQKGASARFNGSLVITSNFPVFVGSKAKGIERRTCLIKFNKQVPVHQRDNKIEERIAEELSALTAISLMLSDSDVNQFIKGIGDGHISDYKKAAWEGKCQIDSIAAWMNDHIILDPNSNTPSKRLFESYTSYCSENGERNVYSLKSFSPSLIDICRDNLEHQVDKKKTNAGRLLMGLRLRTSVDENVPCIDEMLEKVTGDGSSVGLVTDQVSGSNPLSEGKVTDVTGQEASFSENLDNSSLTTAENQKNEKSLGFTRHTCHESAQTLPDKGFNPSLDPSPNPSPVTNPSLESQNNDVAIKVGDFVIDVTGEYVGAGEIQRIDEDEPRYNVVFEDAMAWLPSNRIAVNPLHLETENKISDSLFDLSPYEDKKGTLDYDIDLDS